MAMFPGKFDFNRLIRLRTNKVASINQQDQ